jgi:hypothetical protein
MGCELTENRFSVVEDVMAKIGVFDLCSFFWTVAGTRKRGEDPYGLALQVFRYIRDGGPVRTRSAYRTA